VKKTTLFNKICVLAVFILFASFSFHTTTLNAQTLNTTDLGLNNQVQNTIGAGSNTDLRLTIANIIRTAFGLLGIVALVITLYGGFVFMTAGGEEEKVSTAKKILTNGIIGLVLIMSAYAIVSFVIKNLVDANNNSSGGGGNGGGGGGTGGQFGGGNSLYVASLPPSMELCVRNAKLAVVFNKEVDLTTIVPANIAVLDNASGDAVVAGAWAYGVNKNTVLFTPDGPCGAPDNGNDCFKSKNPYTLKFIPPTNNITTLDKTLKLDCSSSAHPCEPVSFTSGENIDRTQPQISFKTPSQDSIVSIGDPVPVKLSYVSESGLQSMALSIVSNSGNRVFFDSKSANNCAKTGDFNFSWQTSGLQPNGYKLSAVGINGAGLSDSKEQSVTLKNATCVASDPPVCGTGSGCGSCDGDVCTVNSDCASGSCVDGKCATVMSISGFSPASGGPGSYVSIFGSHFGTTPGHVYFTDGTTSIEANLAPCGSVSWKNSQIIVQVPEITATQGIIKVVTAAGQEDTTAKHQIDNFVLSSVVSPGICAVYPEVAIAGSLVAVEGNNFGATQASADSVVLSGLKAPVQSRNGNAAWQDTKITAAVPSLAPGATSLKVVNNGVDSNSVKFVVDDGTVPGSPIIESITPATGTRGDYITIKGKNFGSEMGLVWFKESVASHIDGDFSFPVACAKSVWQDGQIIVKFPSSAVNNTNYVVMVQRSGDNATSAYDPNFSYKLFDGKPSPGICALSPNAGPIPLPDDGSIEVVGEHFLDGNVPADPVQTLFWSLSSVNVKTADGRPVSVLQNSLRQATFDTLVVKPTNDIVSGPVSVYRPSDKKISNGVGFTVGDCTANGATCSGDSHCCSAGSQKGVCQPVGVRCKGEELSTGFVWKFSTKNIPPTPHVVESCDNVTEAGQALPSPSPSTQWDDAYNSDAEKVCRQALVTVEFTTKLDQNTINASNIEVRKCADVTKDGCVEPSGIIALDPAKNPYNLLSAFGDANNSHQYLSLFPSAQKWDDNSWYQVVLKNTIKSEGGDDTIQINLAPDRPCGGDSAYCFYFKSGSKDCELGSVVVTPYRYWTNILERPMKKPPHDATSAPVIYRGNGLSDQRCIMMSMNNWDWNWASGDTNLADFNGSSVAQTVEVNALANTVGINIPGNAVDISATASKEGVTPKPPGTSPLTIDLSNPQVINFWPQCQEACTNAEVAVQFNMGISSRNLDNPSTVRLLKCYDDNCLKTDDVTYAASIHIDESAPFATIKIANANSDVVGMVHKGQNLVVNGFADSGTNNNFSQAIFSPETHGGSGSFASTIFNGGYFSDQLIPVDPTKSYYLEGWAKSGNNNGAQYYSNNRQYFGIVPFDADGKMIDAIHYVNVQGAVDTELADTLSFGATEIHLKDVTGWQNAGPAYQRQIRWYGYKDYADHTYTQNTSFYLRNKDGTYSYLDSGLWKVGDVDVANNTIKLSAPWVGLDLPKGTLVSNASSGGTYRYLALAGSPVSNGWQKYFGTIGGYDTLRNGDRTKFPYGTVGIKIMFLTNYDNGEKTAVGAVKSYVNNIHWSDIQLYDTSAYSAPTSDALEPNTLYKVVVSNTSTNPKSITNNIWARSTAFVASSIGKPYNQQFSWRFKTKAEACVIDRVAMNPQNFDAANIYDRAVYVVQPFSSPDACSATGQKLNPWVQNWTWDSSSSSVAAIKPIKTLGSSPFCTAACVRKGSSISSDNYVEQAVCGNGVQEAGEDCDKPNALANCGLDCRKINNRNIGSFSEPSAKNIASSTCGSGLVGVGEDCDLGIKGSVSNTSSALNCSNICLHTGTPLSSKWCSEHSADRGDFSVADYNSACAVAISTCGNGIDEPTEDVGCDLGNIKKGTHASWCSANCVVVKVDKNNPKPICNPETEEGCKDGYNYGSSLEYSAPSVCGDGEAGIGEDSFCEQNINNRNSFVITNKNNFFNPWAIALGFGQGTPTGDPLAQRTNISATTVVSNVNKQGSGSFNITCGYTSDSECASIDSSLGLGSDSCCYARASLIPPTIPTNGASSVCRNTALQANFLGKIDPATLPGNFLIARAAGDGAHCNTQETDVTTLVNSAGVWCAGSVTGTATIIEPSATTSQLSVSLSNALDKDAKYTVVLTNGVKDERGVPTKAASWQFTTGKDICTVKSVAVTPANWYFSKPNDTVRLNAVVSASNNAVIQSIPGIYAWDYYWKPNDSQFVTIPATTIDKDDVTSLNRNGEVDARVFVRITDDISKAATGTVANGSSHLIVYLCENPWPTKTPGIFPYQDSPDNLAGFDLNSIPPRFDGSKIPPAVGPNVPGDGYFNFSAYYCADNGSVGKLDDWPYLQPVVQADASEIETPQGSSPFKRFIFSNNVNNDAVGIQIFPNPQHLSPSEWYGASAGAGGQGFRGTVQTLKVSGYSAVSDGNNIYVAALNYATDKTDLSKHNLYDVIYLFSINPDAKPETRHVFEDFMKNLRFNTNLTYNDGYCGTTFDKPLYETKCSSDLDCNGGQVCSNEVAKFQRNFERLRNVQQIDALLTVFKIDNSGVYPSLPAGTYLTGQTISTWPSWNVLGNAVGRALPVDPVNKLGKAGTCKTDSSKFCTVDSDCTTDTCVIHELNTGWSTVDRRFSFACAPSSYAYRYIASPTDYKFYLRMENPGVDVNNLAGFIGGFGISSNHFNGLENWGTTLLAGICTGENEISTLSSGKCGDGVINPGEACDPLGSIKFANVQQCTNSRDSTLATKQKCENNCKNWSISEPAVCTDITTFKCGNGKIDPGETCDDGVLNNKYNHCNSTCNGRFADYCGDKEVTPGFEVCDINKDNPGICKLSTDLLSSVPCGGANGIADCSALLEHKCTTEQPNYCVMHSENICNIDGVDDETQTCNGDADCPVSRLPAVCTTFNISPLIIPTASLSLLPSNYTVLGNTECTYVGSHQTNEVYYRCILNSTLGVMGQPSSFFEPSFICNSATNICTPSQINNTTGVATYVNFINSYTFALGQNCVSTPSICIPANKKRCTGGMIGGASSVGNVCSQDADCGGPVETTNCPAVGTATCERSSLVGTDRYAHKKVDSCAWNCQNYGPYCGDGIVQSAEQCDGNDENKKINGQPVHKKCSSACRWQTADFVPLSNVYHQDFESGVASEWSLSTVSVSNGEKFLANSANGFEKVTTTISLANLPTHTVATVIFDLYIINTWDGNSSGAIGPDNWQLVADGVTRFLSSFASVPNFTNYGTKQIFPDQLPPYGNGASHDGGTGAIANNQLTSQYGNSTYHITVSFPHSASSLNLNFAGLQNQPISDEGWGIDNVNVNVNVDSSNNSNPIVGNCGDGVIQANEACDDSFANGLNNNGKVCTPTYGHSCSYCAAIPYPGCKNIVTVQPQQYCGDNILQPLSERCEMKPDGTIDVPSSTIPSGVTTIGLCSESPNPAINLVKGPNQLTHLKGTRSCSSNCSVYNDTCIACGLDQKNGQLVSGNIINVLGGSDIKTGDVAKLKLYFGATSPEDNLVAFSSNIIAPASTGAFPTFKLSAAPETTNPAKDARLVMNAACFGPGNPSEQYKLVVNNDILHPFTVPQSIVGKPYNIILSPTVTDLNQLRIIVRWEGSTNLMGGFVKVGQSGVIESKDLLPISTSNYDSRYASPTSSIWYHGAKAIGTTIAEESFTVKTNDTFSAYQFYVRASNGSPIESSRTSGNVQVDVYRAGSEFGSPFSKPAYTFQLTSADRSSNSQAKYWYVFKILQDTATDSVLTVNSGNGRVATDPTQFDR